MPGTVCLLHDGCAIIESKITLTGIQQHITELNELVHTVTESGRRISQFFDGFPRLVPVVHRCCLWFGCHSKLLGVGDARSPVSASHAEKNTLHAQTFPIGTLAFSVGLPALYFVRFITAYETHVGTTFFV